MPLQTHILAVRQPISAGVATRTLALTTTDASVTLPAGGYELVLGASSEATTAAAPPTTVATECEARVAPLPSRQRAVRLPGLKETLKVAWPKNATAHAGASVAPSSSSRTCRGGGAGRS